MQAGLTTPPQAYAVLVGYDSAMLLTRRALRAAAPAALDEAQERLAAAEKASERLPSGKALHERFRSACD